MSLNWELGKIKDWEKVCNTPEGLRRSKTTTLVWLTIPCGYDRITEENYEAIFQRIFVYEKSRGVMTFDGEGNEDPVTLKDVKDHIGLYTNASKMTDAKFKTNLVRIMFEDAATELRRQKEKMK